MRPVPLKTLFRGAVAVALAVNLSGCASLITGGDLIHEGVPTGVIEVVNGSDGDVTAVLISGCEVGSYGLNRLPAGVVIAPGRSYSFTVSAGCWDVDAGSAAQGEARQRMHVQAGGGVRYTVT